MPRVARLSIAPVRSLGLVHPDEVDISTVGVAEDRRFYLVDATNRLIDRLVVAELVQITSATDAGGTWLRLTMPDGTVIVDEVRVTEPIETPMYGRTAVGHVVDGPWAEPLSAFTGRAIRVVRCDQPAGTRAGNPASIIGDGSLRRLARELGVEAIDARRFRMLIELEDADEHEEDGWVGEDIAVGDAVLRVTKPDGRCAITTQHPDSGVRDLDTLRGIIAYRGLRDGKHADLGVLADVVAPGRVRVGDDVRAIA
jgi:uncharacterized protein YcbX